MKHNLQIPRFSLHKFDNRDSINFSVENYSKLKYGSGEVAKLFGEELALKFYEEHYSIIVSKKLVVMESAYAYIKNAASLITDHFVNKLNSLIAELNGQHVERLKINRLVPYIADYGKLSVKKRIQLLKKDTFTFDADFVKNKFMIFLDDIFITGTHQMKIEEMLQNYNINPENGMCVYYAELTDPMQDPAIESYLNTYYIKDIVDLGNLMQSDSNYEVVVRTIKSILAEPNIVTVTDLVEKMHIAVLTRIYNDCLGEGYYANPAFGTNFAILRKTYLKRSKK